MLGFQINSLINLGDKLAQTSFPENYYNQFGEKVIDLDNYWAFDYNPYVVRNVEPTEVINIRNTDPHRHYGVKRGLNHPRYYFNENITVNVNSAIRKVVVHTHGKSVGEMPAHVIRKIYEKYPDHWVYQIGEGWNTDSPFMNRKNYPIWDVVKLISECEIFIGVDSAMMHIAAAYPQVRMKIVVINESEESLGKKHVSEIGWTYPWAEVFNASEVDIGETRSYLKI